MRFITYALALVFLSGSVCAQSFSTSALNPTSIDPNMGFVTGSFPAGNKPVTYYFSADLQKGELLTQISFAGRSNSEKKLDFDLMDAAAKKISSYYISTSYTNEQAIRAFPIDTAGRYVFGVTLTGPETATFRVEAGGSAFPSVKPQMRAGSNEFSTSALFPTPVDASGLIKGTFPGGSDDYRTYYYFSIDLKKGDLITQISFAGRPAAGSSDNVSKELDFDLLGLDKRKIGSYYISTTMEPKQEASKAFPIDTAGRYMLRVILKGVEGTAFKIELGGAAFTPANPQQ